jgi:hypothetical protein
MFWAALAGGALLGALKNQQERKQIDKENDIAATQTRWSSLTGNGIGKRQSAPSAWGDMLSGGASMGMLYANAKKAGAFEGDEGGGNGPYNYGEGEDDGTSALQKKRSLYGTIA